jgi:Thioredoxin domain
MSYGILATPGVVVDGRVVHSGGVPAREKIAGWLVQALRRSPAHRRSPPIVGVPETGNARLVRLRNSGPWQGFSRSRVAAVDFGDSHSYTI